MNRIVYTLFFLLTFSISYASTMELGYCNGQVSDITTGKVGKCDISAAIILDKEVLKNYIGAKATGIKLYLNNIEDMSDLRGWIRKSLEDENILNVSTEVITTGWQTLPFDESIIIDGSPIVVGYTFTQSKNVNTITFGGDFNVDGRYIAKNDNWETANVLKKNGSICIELVVEGPMIYEKDLGILSLKVPPVKKGEKLIGKAIVKNSSLSIIEGFDYFIKINNSEEYKFRSEDIIFPKLKSELNFEIDTDNLPEEVPLDLELGISTEGDENYDNDILTCSTGCYEKLYHHNLLLEEFTTELCPNCPRAINTINQAMINGYSDKMTVVAHHVGFGIDWLTIEEDKELLWFYGENNGTFAPAVMLDRKISEEGVISPVENIGYFDTFQPRLDDALKEDSFVDIESSAWYDDEKIYVSLQAEAHPLFETICSSPNITVLLVENNVKHHQQAGISNEDFKHSHVTRAYLTSVFGDSFSWENRIYDWNGEIEIDQEWDVQNMEVVSFISNFDSEDITNCEIYNSTSSNIKESGINILNPENQSFYFEYYTLEGLKVDKPEKGIYIIKKIYNNGNIEILKQFF